MVVVNASLAGACFCKVCHSPVTHSPSHSCHRGTKPDKMTNIVFTPFLSPFNWWRKESLFSFSFVFRASSSSSFPFSFVAGLCVQFVPLLSAFSLCLPMFSSFPISILPSCWIVIAVSPVGPHKLNVTIVVLHVHLDILVLFKDLQNSPSQVLLVAWGQLLCTFPP